ARKAFSLAVGTFLLARRAQTFARKPWTLARKGLSLAIGAFADACGSEERGFTPTWSDFPITQPALRHTCVGRSGDRGCDIHCLRHYRCLPCSWWAAPRERRNASAFLPVCRSCVQWRKPRTTRTPA